MRTREELEKAATDVMVGYIGRTDKPSLLAMLQLEILLDMRELLLYGVQVDTEHPLHVHETDEV